MLGNAAPPDKGPLALRGVGPVVLPMVRKALEVPRRRGLVWMCPHTARRATRWNVLLIANSQKKRIQLTPSFPLRILVMLELEKQEERGGANGG